LHGDLNAFLFGLDFVHAAAATYNRATLPDVIAKDSYWIVGVVAAYYAGAWLLVERRRAGRSITIRYRPPEGLSPAAVRYVYTVGSSDGRTYAAIVAQLAARKLLAIVPQHINGAICVAKLKEDRHLLRSLPAEERRVFEDLLEFDERTPLKRPELRSIGRIQKILDESLPGKYFTRNLAWVILGWLATAALTAWLGLSSGLFAVDAVDAWMLSLFTGLTVAMYSAAGYWMWDTNRLAIGLALRGLYRRRSLPLLMAFIILYPALWYAIISMTAPSFAKLTVALIVLNALAAPALRNYTAAGRQARDEIEGFRQFLQSTEQDRLQRMNHPEQEAGFDTEFIPYAIALDLREEWGDRLGIQAMVETAL
jgi:hypothetical protein